MRRFQISLFVALMAVAICPIAWGHGTPISLSQSGGKIHTDAQVYESALTLVAGTVLTTDLPGFDVATTSMGIAPGTTIGMNVMESLWYWNGFDLVTPTAELTFENEDLDSVTVTGSSGFQLGPSVGTYTGAIGWHQHGYYTLEPHTAPTGAYGLVLQVTAGAFEPSDPILVVFNHGLDSGSFAQGVDAIANEVFAVPEPSSVAMMGLGAMGLAGMAWRRRRRRGDSSAMGASA